MNIDKPSLRRHADIKNKIIESAIKIITKEGIDKLSIRNLAEKMNYTPGALYKYYKNKEEILNGIKNTAYEKLNQYETANIPKNLTTIELIMLICKRQMEFAKKNPEIYLVLFNHKLSQFHDGKALAFTQLTKIIENGIEKGEIILANNYTPYLLAFQLKNTIHGVIMTMLTAFSKPPAEHEKHLLEILNLFLRFFIKK